MKIRYAFQWLVLLFLLSAAVYAAPSFPRLSGRVVDEAHVLTPQVIQQLDTLLANYEAGTTNQVVVVTLPSLQGYSIEDYGYQLGRYWQIGQKDQNNGVLLIVAPTERKVRIEVGYGLEPILTDAVSSTIIQGIIVPNFRAGQLSKGVVDGTQAIVDVLGGKSISVPVQNASDSKPFPAWLSLICLLLFWWFVIRHPFLALFIFGSGNSGRGGFGGSSGGGGFSGGGGSFGGGGSSGSW